MHCIRIMKQSEDRILVTHVGSLPRPPDLLELLERKEAGEAVDDDQWQNTVTAATETVVDRQADVGIDIANDGEQARVSFNWYVANRLSGLGGEREVPLWDDLLDYPEYAEDAFSTDVIDLQTGPALVDAVGYCGREELEAELDTFSHLLKTTDHQFAETFMTSASPGIAAATLVNEHYDSHREFVFAVADAMREEYSRIADTGMVLQLDAPDLLASGHRNAKNRSVEDIKRLVRLHIEALNESIKDIPPEQVRVHTCWGSYEGPHHRDIALVEMLPELYEMDVRGLSIEQANPRHQHEYSVFEEHPLPDGWTFIPGVIDVKTNVVEHPEVIADRLERVIDAIGDPRRVIAAPDCGFDTQAGLGMVHPEIAWAKLEALADGAAVATDRLY